MTEPRIAVVTRQQGAVVRELTRDGATDPEIAARLHISVWTVKSHMKGALKAAGQPNRTALAVALFRGQVVLGVVKSRRGSEAVA